MDKSGVIVGSLLGATVVLLLFAFVLMPPTAIQRPDVPPTGLITTNGHSVNIVGETTPIFERKNLSLIEIFEQSEAGVVRVNVQRTIQVLGTSSVGSGFVFDNNGHIITNAHVIEDVEKIVVTFLDGRSYNAKLVGKDPFTDISVIKVDVD